MPSSNGFLLSELGGHNRIMMFFKTNVPVDQDIIRVMHLNLSYTKGSGRV